MDTDLAGLEHRLRQYGQDHVLSGWGRLTAGEQQTLIGQLAPLDLGELGRLYARRNEARPLPPRERISPVPVEPPEATDPDARRAGEAALARGEVAVLVVAGGQGSRLGFGQPKGMYPIGPVSGKSLFQIHAEKVFAVGRRFGRVPPFLVMTSPATHAATEAYFAENGFFGLPPDSVSFFRQGVMPVLDLATGRLLRNGRGELVTSPNGHGGVLPALAGSGLLGGLRRGGVRHVFYCQVDNPLVRLVDPGFVGRHIAAGSQVSSKVVSKDRPEEKVGVFALVDGRCSVIEYTDLPGEAAGERGPGGGLLFRAGNPAIHLFDIDFLTRVTQGGERPEWHVVRKRVSHIDGDGPRPEPRTTDALKFEAFVFDVLPLADRWLVVETSRREEFAPLKNGDGPDSPAAVRQALTDLVGDWLGRMGVSVPRDDAGRVTVPLEVSPRFALDAAEFAARVSPARTVRGPTYWE